MRIENEEARSYQPAGWPAKTLPEIARGIRSGELSAVEAAEAYLARIAALDRRGPMLRSVIAVNPDALDEARRLDDLRAAGGKLGALHGVPILLKDNIESRDNMATTAGALVLEGNITGRDSPAAAGLRAAGALILGKTNLSEWANFRSEHSMSGWSALGGQVRNPHILDRNPCGSSSGSGAAAAASLAAGTVGTETNGSIICPANVNGIVGFKPTVGVVSQEGIVPISCSQDTAGPMTKTVAGAAMMLGAMAGDAEGAAGGRGEEGGEGASGDAGAKRDYLEALDAGSLEGARIGVLRYAAGTHRGVLGRFAEALRILEAGGAELVEIEKGPERPDVFERQAYTVLLYEFRDGVNRYLAEAAPAVRERSLAEVTAFNIRNGEKELALFDQSIFEKAEALGDLGSPEYIEARDAVQRAAREEGIDMLLSSYGVDVLIAPSGPIASCVDALNGDVWPPFPGAGSMAAIAGYPHLSVPMGAVHGMPAGLSFIGGQNQDARVLSFGFAFERLGVEFSGGQGGLRVEPQYWLTAEGRPEIAPAMEGIMARNLL